ncbi:hypothetical protein D3C86_1414660 [compost metagenome]
MHASRKNLSSALLNFETGEQPTSEQPIDSFALAIHFSALWFFQLRRRIYRLSLSDPVDRIPNQQRHTLPDSHTLFAFQQLSHQALLFVYEVHQHLHFCRCSPHRQRSF